MKNQKFRKLDVWNKAMLLTENVYEISTHFPNQEIYGLTSQLRRASVSVSLNIAEGSGSSSDAEFRRFLDISRRSCYEVMCGIEIAVRLKYCSAKDAETILQKCDELSAMLTGLKQKLKPGLVVD